MLRTDVDEVPIVDAFEVLQVEIEFGLGLGGFFVASDQDEDGVPDLISGFSGSRTDTCAVKLSKLREFNT